MAIAIMPAAGAKLSLIDYLLNLMRARLAVMIFCIK
jgi:hypothetical protein